MARKSATITIDEGRDAGKSFVITEMPAKQWFDWSRRALIMVSRESFLPNNVKMGDGIAGMAETGFAALLFCENASSLLDELMGCIKFKTPTDNSALRDLIESDTEDAETITKLLQSTYNLHMDFSKAADLLKSDS